MPPPCCATWCRGPTWCSPVRTRRRCSWGPRRRWTGWRRSAPPRPWSRTGRAAVRRSSTATGSRCPRFRCGSSTRWARATRSWPGIWPTGSPARTPGSDCGRRSRWARTRGPRRGTAEGCRPAPNWTTCPPQTCAGKGRTAAGSVSTTPADAGPARLHVPRPSKYGPAVAPPISLGTWPTPLEPAPRLAASLGLEHLWIKRDDLIGLGGGGNKVRKLQYTCAQALQAGATTLITTGAPQSNHARLTAAAAARLGLRCVLVLAGDRPVTSRGNLVLDSFAGAEIVWAGRQSPVQVIEAEIAKRYKPYVIPFGGSSSESAQGYVDCAREIEAQLPDADRVVVPVGSGGTMAGLVAALGPDRVFGVDTGAVSDARMTVAALLDGMPGVTVDPGDLKIDRGQIGGGYAKLTERVREALK